MPSNENFIAWVYRYNKSVGCDWSVPPPPKKMKHPKKLKYHKHLKLNWTNVTCDGIPKLKRFCNK